MRILFFITVAFAGGVLLARRRRFDLFTLGFLSSLVYYLPAFIGVAADVSLVGEFAVASWPIGPRVYGILAILFFGLGSAALLFDSFIERDERRLRFELEGALSTTSLWATALGLLGCFLTWVEARGALFDADKAVVLAALGRWYPAWTLGALGGFLFGIVEGRRLSVAVSTGLILFDVYVGFRSTVALAVLGVFLWFLSRDPQRRLLSVRHAWLAVAGIAIAAGLFAYKGIYQAVKYGAWELVFEQLSNPDYLTEVVLYSSEPFMVSGTLNEVERSGFSIDPRHYGGLVFGLVPFGPELGVAPKSFNDLFQPTLFPEREAGLASNFLAEAWSAGRYAGVLALTAIYIGGLWIGSFLLAARSRLLRVVAVVVFPTWAFYIHRNDLLYQLVLERRIVILLGAAVMLSCLVHGALRPETAKRNVGRSVTA